MHSQHAQWLGVLLLLPSGCTSQSGQAAAADESSKRQEAEEGEEEEREEARELELAAATTLAFEDTALGSLPDGWKVEGTRQEGPLATWKVIEDGSAPSGRRVLALASSNHDSPGTFNLCWTDRIRFRDGAIELAFKAVSGEEDQGGGVIWRALDQDDYYICRANPLESNLRVYYVKDGTRHQLASAKVEIASGTWHTLRIEHEGGRIECSLDGKERLVATDSTLPGEGGVGFWTKADAVTSFDDLRIAVEGASQGGEDDDGETHEER